MDQVRATLDQVLKLLKNPVGGIAQDGVKAIDIGAANKSYVLTTERGGKYVARVLRAQTDESARSEAQIQRALTEAGLHAPLYLPFKDGDVVAHIEGERVTVSPFIEGKSSKVQSIKLTRNLGITLAKIHDALSSLPKDAIQKSSAQAFRVKSIADDIARCPGGELKEMLTDRFENVRTLPEKDLPQAVIHGDLHTLNVFAEDDEVMAIFDFETAEYTIRILDIARTHLEGLEEKIFPPQEIKEALIEGYNSAARVSITDEEMATFDDAVKYVTVANAAWLVNNVSEASARRSLDAVSF